MKDPKMAKRIKAGEKIGADKLDGEKILNRKFIQDEEVKDDKKAPKSSEKDQK